jgi:hypothetical protein
MGLGDDHMGTRCAAWRLPGTTLTPGFVQSGRELRATIQGIAALPGLDLRGRAETGNHLQPGRPKELFLNGGGLPQLQRQGCLPTRCDLPNDA